MQGINGNLIHWHKNTYKVHYFTFFVLGVSETRFSGTRNQLKMGLRQIFSSFFAKYLPYLSIFQTTISPLVHLTLKSKA